MAKKNAAAAENVQPNEEFTVRLVYILKGVRTVQDVHFPSVPTQKKLVGKVAQAIHMLATSSSVNQLEIVMSFSAPYFGKEVLPAFTLKGLKNLTTLVPNTIAALLKIFSNEAMCDDAFEALTVSGENAFQAGLMQAVGAIDMVNDKTEAKVKAVEGWAKDMKLASTLADERGKKFRDAWRQKVGLPSIETERAIRKEIADENKRKALAAPVTEANIAAE